MEMDHAPSALTDHLAEAEQVWQFHEAWRRNTPSFQARVFDLPDACVRLLLELDRQSGLSAVVLGERLRMNQAQVSRSLAWLASRGYVECSPRWDDRRVDEIALTESGREMAGESRAEWLGRAQHWLQSMHPRQKARIVRAMADMEAAMSPQAAKPWMLLVRPARPGDLAWLVERHCVRMGAVYPDIEARMMRRIADFLARTCEMPASQGAAREAAWIAESVSERVGGIVLTGDGAAAELHYLHVEPFAEGLAVDWHLVSTALAFARGAGYATVHARGSHAAFRASSFVPDGPAGWRRELDAMA
jgi:DNA-binding MarR family transcriptional regulator